MGARSASGGTANRQLGVPTELVGPQARVARSVRDPPRLPEKPLCA